MILVVPSLSAGGAERVVSELANLWAASGRRVAILTLSTAEDDHYPLHSDIERIGLGVLHQSTGVLDSVRSTKRRVRSIRAAILRRRPDCVVTFIDTTNTMVMLAMIGTGVPVVVSERVDPRMYRIPFVWAVARRFLYPKSAAVVVQTGRVADWARALVPSKKVHVIPNFVRPMNAIDARHRDPLVLAIGRLTKQKGFDLLLDAFAASDARRAGFTLRILGEGPERRSLERQAAALNIAGQVDLPGVVGNPEESIGRCSIFVLSSRFEGFPNVLLEAMAMGSAVVATDCPSGPAEIVKDGVNGLLVRPEDSGALGRAIDMLINDEALRARLGKAAEGVMNEFSAPRILEQWNQVLRHATGGRWSHDPEGASR